MKQKMVAIIGIFLGLALVHSLSTEHVRFENRVIGVTAQCKDGAFTTAKRGRGVCSGHGGVARWIEKTDAK